MAKLADQFTAFLGFGKKKDVKDVKTRFDRLKDALKELKNSLNEVNVASDLCADAVTQAAVNSDAITQADAIGVLPTNPSNGMKINSQIGMNGVDYSVPAIDSRGGRKSRRGGKKSRRGGKKSRRGGKKSRRGGKKSRRGGKKSRRGGKH